MRWTDLTSLQLARFPHETICVIPLGATEELLAAHWPDAPGFDHMVKRSEGPALALNGPDERVTR
jgi:hypothetical protein